MTSATDRIPILAKSARRGHAVTLSEHGGDVMRATRVMFGEHDRPSPLAGAWLRFFKVPQQRCQEFWRALMVASILHDLGKANSEFQAAVRNPTKMQAIRHEHVTALLLGTGPLANWLDKCLRPVERLAVLSAVASHHCKVGPGSEHGDRELGYNRTGTPSFDLYLGAPELQSTLEMAAEVVGEAAPALVDQHWTFSGDVYPNAKSFIGRIRPLEKEARVSEDPWPLVTAVKAALLLTDSAGSAATRAGLDIHAWLARAFSGEPLTAELVESRVIDPRINELKQQGKWREFHDFQLACAELGDRALLLSGCGTGKTLAAWKWVEERLRAGGYRRAVFLYPTRATASEGFRDYASWAGPKAAALIHGTASFELETMFGNPEDERGGWDFAADERLFALGFWDRRIITATVDTFLAAMSNRYASLCLLPVLAESVVVIDEVHSFDRKMFGHLERFLDNFDVPVLCMTASLPPDRLDVLRGKKAMQVFPDDEHRFEDLERQASAKRYVVRLIKPEEALDAVALALQSGRKVLHVLNTVDRCQTAASALGARFPGQVECFHSRFRLSDRRDRHRKVIDRFQADDAGPLVLVTTQVCEMSLDLDADVLVTEAAPVPSLIQRMGRCCREPMPRAGRIGQVVVCRPATELPYEAAEVAQGYEFAGKIAESDGVSQSDLARYIADLEVNDPLFAGGFSGLLDSKWYANGREDTFREEDSFTTDCILDTDVDDYVSAQARRDSAAAGYVVPAPRYLTQADPRLGQFLRVVPGSHYDQFLGLRGKAS